MKNAHERFGVLEYTKRMKDTTTRIRLRWTGSSARSKTGGMARPTSFRSWAGTPMLAPSGQPSSSRTTLPWKPRGSSR